ncbi:hypothetical protein Q4566_07345 [Tamlana sp. 2_MG-2023]|uniref:hypothetical protein n=1 Tax=unclassified Tamlana TaxID=2614803 RepID=UPI0026E17C17|nr:MULTISPECIES: hypothetical protein [unclassified Tamlana]MDO6760011.1 hypothetical protein [Tamlana sp. 2_MG-2023]MDO6790291.1 hypothetical protein [Tamlana sp. 1_MG-2023]
MDANVDLETLNHYWVLHRYNKDKMLDVMGMPMLPSHLNSNFEGNEKAVLEALNTPGTFDKDIAFKQKDRLEVVLFNHENTTSETLYFNFEFTGKTWKAIEADCFAIMSRFDEVQQGEIKEDDTK